MALGAVGDDPETGARSILGVGRLSKLHGVNEAEFALIVSDHYQGLGLGGELLRRLLEIGRDEALGFFDGAATTENCEMQHLCRKLGFRLTQGTGETVVGAMIDL